MQKVKEIFTKLIVLTVIGFQYAMHKVLLYTRISKAWLRDPWNWRKELVQEYKPYEKFLQGRNSFIANSSYKDYVLFLLSESFKTNRIVVMPGGNKLIITGYDYNVERNCIEFFGKRESHFCSLQYAEGMCGISNNKQADMINALETVAFKTKDSVIKTSTVVPFYDKGTPDNPYVLINDSSIMCYSELDKLLPGGKHA